MSRRSQKKIIHLSLRWRVLGLILVIGILPAAAALLITTNTSIATMRSYVMEGATSSVSSLAEKLSTSIVEEMNQLSKLTLGEEGIVSEEKITLEAVQKMMSRPLYTGDYILRFTLEEPVFDLSESSLELATLLEDLDQTAEDSLVDEPLMIREFSGERPEFWVLSTIEPGRFLESEGGGYLAIRIDPLEMLREESESYLIGQPPPALYTPLSSLYGASWNQPRTFDQSLVSDDIQSSKEGILLDREWDNIAYAFRKIPLFSRLSEFSESRYYVLVVQRVEFDDATVSLFYQFWRTTLIGLVFIGFVGIYGIWISHRLVDRIVTLRDAFQRLEEGDLDHRVELKTGDELEGLADSMNRMAATLQDTYQNLADKLLELDEKAKQISVSYEISKTVNRSLEPEKTFPDIISELAQLFPAEAIILAFVEEDKLAIRYRWPERSPVDEMKSVYPVQKSVCSRLSERHRVTIFHRAETSNDLEWESFLADPAEVICVIPLISSLTSEAYLMLADSNPYAFRSKDLDILQGLAPSLATAVEHSRLYEKQADFANQLEIQVEERTNQLKATQEQLLRIERLATAGELATNIAHEVNNPLSIIKNYLKLIEGQIINLKLQNENTELSLEGIKIIGGEIDRIARIVQQLRQASTPQELPIKKINLNEELESIVELCRQTFVEKNLEIKTELDSRIEEVLLCHDFLRQILINFLRNAHDATPPEGCITISSQLISKKEKRFSVSVSDTGPGIPEELMDKIFNPFFTTKKVGQGSGLGLAVSYSLARNMNGDLEVNNGQSGGAVFTLTLPLNYTREKSSESDKGSPVRKQGDRIIIG